MTSWVWMKGAEKALVDTPIEPLSDRDDRPAVKDLLEKHQKEISKLTSELQEDPLYDASKHDDLWILRFVMSHQRRHKHALKAIKHTLEFRKEHSLDDKDIRYLVPGTDQADCPAMLRICSYADPDTYLWCIPEPQGNVMAFVRYAGLDQTKLMKEVDESNWFPTVLYLSEWAFQWCDFITRTTGRLTKNVRLIDFDGVRLRDMSLVGAKRDSKAMNQTEDCYPQLLRSVYVCHGLTWIQSIWRFVRPLLPKRAVEKVDFIHPKSNDKERDRLLKYVKMELLPERFGGQYKPWPVEYPLPGQK